MITYPYDSRVVAFAIGTLSELWLCDELRPWLMKKAMPTYLKLIENSRNNLVLTHVAKALGRATDYADSLKLMEQANGLTHMARILTPLKREDPMDGGEGFDYHFQPKTIIAVVQSLSEMMTKNAVNTIPQLLHHRRNYRGPEGKASPKKTTTIPLKNVTKLYDKTEKYVKNVYTKKPPPPNKLQPNCACVLYVHRC